MHCHAIGAIDGNHAIDAIDGNGRNMRHWNRRGSYWDVERASGQMQFESDSETTD